MSESPSVLVLVDGANLRGALEDHLGGQRIDAARFVAWICSTYGPPRVVWFQGRYPRLEGLFRQLEAAGIEIRSKEPKNLRGGRKADMDVELALAAREADAFDVVVLVSGDGDLAPVVAELRGGGKRVVVLAHGDMLDTGLMLMLPPEDVVDLRDVLPFFRFFGGPEFPWRAA